MLLTQMHILTRNQRKHILIIQDVVLCTDIVFFGSFDFVKVSQSNHDC